MKLTAIPLEGYYVIVESDEFITSDKPIAQSKQVHPSLPLFDAPWEEDVEGLYFKRTGIDKELYEHDLNYFRLFINGYNAAKAKYEFTREDMEKAIEMAREGTLDYSYGSDCPYYDFKHNESSILQSLKKPKVYEVTIEMQEIKGYCSKQECIENYPHCCLSTESKCMALPATFKPKLTNNKIKILSWEEK